MTDPAYTVPRSGGNSLPIFPSKFEAGRKIELFDRRDVIQVRYHAAYCYADVAAEIIK